MTTTTDPIFRFLEEQHGARAWGRVLDAGTGVHSLRWVASLPGADWTAVTVDERMKHRVLEESGVTGGRVVLGSWTDPQLLAGEAFDVVLADYLLGALDGFTPYFEDQLLPRLKEHVKPGGTLMLAGLEPWGGAENPAQEAFMDLVRLRDASTLLARQRPYREYPQAHVERALTRAGFTVTAAQRFPIRIQRSTVDRQLRNATSQLCCVPPALRAPLEARAGHLRQSLHTHCGEDGFFFGSDHALVAKPA